MVELVRTSVVARRAAPSCTIEVPSHDRNVLPVSTAVMVAVAVDVDAAIVIVPRWTDLIGLLKILRPILCLNSPDVEGDLPGTTADHNAVPTRSVGIVSNDKSRPL